MVDSSFDPGCKARVMNRSNEAATYRAPAINFLPIYYPRPLPVSTKKGGQKEKRAERVNMDGRVGRRARVDLGESSIRLTCVARDVTDDLWRS